MPDFKMDIEELIVLVGTCVATGETYVVPDDKFLRMMFKQAPEQGRMFNPGNFSVDGYLSFTQALLNGEFGTRIEDIQKGLNERWACWDEEHRCFDTSQCPGVIDSYAFVNANSLNRTAFESNPFELEVPNDIATLYLKNDDHRPTPEAVAVKKVEVSTQRKPWLL